MSESEFAKLANEESMLPDELELPEDDTGACYTALMLCDVFYCSIFNDAAQVCECKKLYLQYIYILYVHLDVQPLCLDLPSLLDPTILIEADGSEDAKKSLKSLAWPLMDDPDALPSTYIPKVLTCLSKWSVKMQDLDELVVSLESPHASLAQFFGLTMFN